MVKKKVEYVMIRFLKDYEPAKKGEICRSSKSDAKKMIKNKVAELIDSKREKEAKWLSDKATLDGPFFKYKKDNNGYYKYLDEQSCLMGKVSMENADRWIDEKNKEIRENISNDYLIELKNPNLLNNIIKEIQLKVVGEEDSIKGIFLCSCGRLVEDNHIASFNLLVNSKSGTGKDFVTTATTNLWDRKVCIKRTRISPTAFTYWHDANLDPDWTWDGKILVLEDISENVLNSDVFKVMQSSGSIATIVVNNKAKDLEVKGKPVIIITTAKASPDIELIRRNSICQLDESEKQTKDILKEQAIKAMNGIVDKHNPKIKKAINTLKRVKVKIPFANLLVNSFPTDLVMRTAFNRFIDLIKASAALHQFQREIDKKSYILANEIDYNNARDVLNHFNKEGHSVTLTRDQQDILNVFKDDKFYSIDYISSKIPLSDKWLRIQLDKLAEMNFLEVEGIRDEALKNRFIRNYRKIYELDKIYLPKFEKLNKNGGKNA